jgi:iron complex outermembrane receptor protein
MPTIEKPLPSRRRILPRLLVLWLTGALPAAAAQELIDLPLEQLFDVKIYSASKFYQKASDAPSAVSVITAAEFRQYGWRTVGEMLRSLRGFSIASDRLYDFIGVRGFARSGDYNSRMLVLIDGYRVNDNIYDTGYVGTELTLDVDLIDRVEVVRGPSASMYGSNALFGVVNIVTRSGGELQGGEAAASIASYHTAQGRLSYGGRAQNGAQLLLSATLHDSEGPTLTFDDIDPTGAPVSAGSGTDYTYAGHFFGKFSYNGLTVTASAGERRKGAGTGMFAAMLNDPRSRWTDVSYFLTAEQQVALATGHDLSARLSYGHYDFLGNYVFDVDGAGTTLFNVDTAHGGWWTAELKLVSQLGERHKLVSGVELQQNFRQAQYTYDDDPYALLQDDRRSGRRVGIYLQDEYRHSDALSFTFGGRFDKYTDLDAQANPRFALVYRSAPETVWKLMYGSAFRAPNAYERFYGFPDYMIPGGALEPEKIRTLEAVVEHYLRPKSRVLLSLYSFRMEDLIDLRTSPEDENLLQFQQVGGVRSNGAELELEHEWDNGARLRSSVSLQNSQDDDGADVLGSPERMFKLNLSAPLPGVPVHAGIEFQAMSARKSQSQDAETGELVTRSVSGFALTNLTLSTPPNLKGWQFSAGVYNLSRVPSLSPGLTS